MYHTKTVHYTDKSSCCVEIKELSVFWAIPSCWVLWEDTSKDASVSKCRCKCGEAYHTIIKAARATLLQLRLPLCHTHSGGRSFATLCRDASKGIACMLQQ